MRMSTAEWFAFWALIISGATLLTYLGQLTVLILVYRRVIKETDRNAEERRREIERNAEERRRDLEKAGGMLQEMGKNMEQGVNKIAKRNTILMGLAGVCAAMMFFANQSTINKF